MDKKKKINQREKMETSKKVIFWIDFVFIIIIMSYPNTHLFFLSFLLKSLYPKILSYEGSNI